MWNDSIKLTGKDVPKHLRGTYTGRKFKVVAKEEIIIPSDANLWDGGSCDKYYAIRLADGVTIALGSSAAPWAPERVERTVKLVPDIAVVMHSIFCGRDSGLTFYIHPSNMPKFIS